LSREGRVMIAEESKTALVQGERAIGCGDRLCGCRGMIDRELQREERPQLRVKGGRH
jgi:hypothetical protein